MKEKNITDVHLLLEKTIAERNEILPLWQDIFVSGKPVKKDVHAQLRETIKELKRTKEQIKYFFDDRNKVYRMTGKSAA